MFVLVKTSNPSSVEIQDLVVDGDCVHIHTARLVDSLNDDRVGKTGYGPVGAVVGATWPDLVVTLRKILSRSILLLPGYGAQGAGAEDVARAFDSEGQGALVSASRSITFPWAAESSCPTDWIDRIGQAADEMSRDLRRVSTFGA